jgi:hypothetical protein
MNNAVHPRNRSRRPWANTHQQTPASTGTTTRAMYFTKGTKTFSVEASSLCWFPYWRPGNGRLMQVHVTSHVTGQKQVFDFIREETSGGEVVAWHYANKDFKLIVYND